MPFQKCISSRNDAESAPFPHGLTINPNGREFVEVVPSISIRYSRFPSLTSDLLQRYAPANVGGESVFVTFTGEIVRASLENFSSRIFKYMDWKGRRFDTVWDVGLMEYY